VVKVEPVDKAAQEVVRGLVGEVPVHLAEMAAMAVRVEPVVMEHPVQVLPSPKMAELR